MRTDQPVPVPVRLQDYRPPAFSVETVRLDFDLHPTAARVRGRLEVRRQGASAAPLVLDGVRLKLISAAVDGRPLSPADYTLDADGLTVANVPDVFVLETEVEIDPKANTALEGLYMSGGRFCTQCEAEGFRKITFFPDRPDVLARYTVRLEADAQAYPRLLSNGNLVEHGALQGGRHFAVWNDPFPKPCYLFAAVAGELDELADSFVTLSGRRVELRIYVDPGQSARAAYAMDALKRAMRFDETAFGREYDLDLFMIVAVRDFNFGAMENKGLNIFNSSLLLADPQTATDADYERIESVVAHEYFHNWTGNRITCRDWFQLCLKEGLTVFRDQAFSAQERGAAVQRIKDVRALRGRQFAEDAGPLAHPVRPSSYLKIDNFYTATIYEKGAEIIRMLSILLGEVDFRRGLDLYFDRWDGDGDHGRGLPRLLRRGVRARPRHRSCAGTSRRARPRCRFGGALRRGRPGPRSDPAPDHARHAWPAGQGLRCPSPWRFGLLDATGAPQDPSAFLAPNAATRAATLEFDAPEMRLRLEGVAAPAGAVRAARLFRPRSADHRRAAPGRLRPAGRRPGPVQPLGGRPEPWRGR